jgi:hypothetical protein
VPAQFPGKMAREFFIAQDGQPAVRTSIAASFAVFQLQEL